MNTPVETIEHNGKTIEIFVDEDPQNPRDENYSDHLETMVCFHKRYSLGDKHDYKQSDFNSWDELEAKIIKDHDPIVIQPLYLYDHSGITISTSHEYPYNDRWDSGQVGFVFIPRKKMLEEWSMKRASKKLVKKAEKYIDGMVEEYDQYLTGEVYGYVIKDADGNDGDSCWGFYGMKYCIEEAKSAVGDNVDTILKQAELNLA